jgi:UDP-2,3-diacylglucosamine pyrophosphatase LpxH
MKILYILLIVILLCLVAIFIRSKLVTTKTASIDPFTNDSNKRDLVVVISDLHMGADLSYAEINDNRKPLENFLEKVRVSPKIKELVITGDLVDEWFVPATVDTYQGKDQASFVKRIATTNKEVFEAFNRIIKEGKIKVTYIPGNHDLTVTAKQIESVLPGISQVRDDVQGLGTYSPTDLPQVAIEHGHRYNFFCAPDPISNQAVAPGTIMPPGYFFTRIAAQHVQEQAKTSSNIIPTVTPNSSGGVSQDLMYGYWKIWQGTLNSFPITNKFDEKIITTNVDGFKGNYSINDLVPFQLTPGGTIDVNLYKGIQDTWKERQKINHVAVEIPTAHAIQYVTDPKESDNQAAIQYFTNPVSNKRIVIFGHTHVADMIASTNAAGKKTIYANSGTWIDSNPSATTMNFVVIAPQTSDPSSQTTVKLYNLKNETTTQMAEDSLRFE